MCALAACFGSVSGASRYDRSWPQLGARAHATLWQINGLHWVFIAVRSPARGIVAALTVPAGRAAELKRVDPVPAVAAAAPKL